MSVRGDVFSGSCPSRAVLGLIANKWSLLVLDALADEPVRNGALLRRIEGISQKMLTQTLRELEDANMVRRETHDVVPPHVEYSLTDTGRGLRTIVSTMHRWIEDHLDEIACNAGQPMR